jgi:hypothetical protein
MAYTDLEIGLAEGCTVPYCTVPLDLASRSVIASAAYMSDVGTGVRCVFRKAVQSVKFGLFCAFVPKLLTVGPCV